MKYRLAFLASALNLLWERTWQDFWPAFGVAAVYASLSLLGLPSFLNGAARALLLAGFAGAFLYALDRYGRGFRLPAVSDVERKMEEAGGLAHRPLAVLRDRPAGGAKELWNVHLRRAAGAKGRVRVYLARPDVARDRYGLRYAALILLLLSLVAARHDAGARLREGFSPGVSLAFLRQKTEMDVWITPPDYTHQAPVFLASSQAGAGVGQNPVAVPAGSVLKVRISGGYLPPRLRYAGKSIAFTGGGAQGHILETVLGESGRLRIRQGFSTAGAWKIDVEADRPPEIAVISAAPTPRAALKITYRAKDDYGVTRLTGTVTPPENTPSDASARVETFDMSPPDAAQDENTYTVDLTSNIRAGLPALLSLTAVDNAGHIVSTEPFPITLPERKFNNPQAQRLILDRKKLATARDPLTLRLVAGDVGDLASRPGLYKGDIVLFMALGSAARRLAYDGSADSITSVQDILWDAALKLEDGGLSVAARELNDALQKLSQALSDKSLSKDDLQKLVNDAQKKMQQYIQALAREMAQRQDGAPKIPPGIAQKIMKRIDLDQLMQQLRQLSESDPRAALQKMAEFLKNAVNNIDPEKMKQMQERQARQMQALQDLQDIIDGQQDLMDRTGKLDPQAKGAEESQRQDGLRAKLGDAARKMGEAGADVPENLAAADQAMKQAQGAFKSGAPKGSLPHQKEALDQLQKGMDSVIQKMAEGMQQTMLSFGLMPGGGGQGEGYDPLGREDGRAQGGDIKLPDQREQRRVQEIIRELRSRSNDYQRPKVEREYIDRLLDQMN